MSESSNDSRPIHERMGLSDELDEALGQIAVNTIIEGSLVRVESRSDAGDVLVWSSTACEQVGQAVLAFLKPRGYRCR